MTFLTSCSRESGAPLRSTTKVNQQLSWVMLSSAIFSPSQTVSPGTGVLSGRVQPRGRAGAVPFQWKAVARAVTRQAMAGYLEVCEDLGWQQCHGNPLDSKVQKRIWSNCLCVQSFCNLFGQMIFSVVSHLFCLSSGCFYTPKTNG